MLAAFIKDFLKNVKKINIDSRENNIDELIEKIDDWEQFKIYAALKGKLQFVKLAETKGAVEINQCMIHAASSGSWSVLDYCKMKLTEEQETKQLMCDCMINAAAGNHQNIVYWFGAKYNYTWKWAMIGAANKGLLDLFIYAENKTDDPDWDECILAASKNNNMNIITYIESNMIDFNRKLCMVGAIQGGHFNIIKYMEKKLDQKGELNWKDYHPWAMGAFRKDSVLILDYITIKIASTK